MNSKMEIPVNNGGKLILELDAERGGLRMTLEDSAGHILRRDLADAGQIVMLHNWFVYQVDSGNTGLMF